MAFFMRMEKWYHSIQDWHRFADSVIDLVEDYLKYGNGIDENDGIYVDEDDEAHLANREMTPDDDNFHPIIELLDMKGDSPEVNYSAVEELTDKYIFVR